jgi:hypothetical protein
MGAFSDGQDLSGGGNTFCYMNGSRPCTQVVGAWLFDEHTGRHKNDAATANGAAISTQILSAPQPRNITDRKVIFRNQLLDARDIDGWHEVSTPTSLGSSLRPDAGAGNQVNGNAFLFEDSDDANMRHPPCRTAPQSQSNSLSAQ